MNRAERRRLAKAEQKKAKEKPLAIKPSSLAEYEQQTLQNVIDAYFDFTTVCFAKVLRDELGFGGKRIFRMMEKVRETYAEMDQDENHFQEVVSRLEAETGLEFDTRILR